MVVMSMVVVVTIVSILRLSISASLPVVTTIWVAWVVVWWNIVSPGEMGIGLRCCNWVCIGFRFCISAPLPVVTTIWVTWVVVWWNIVSSGEMWIGLRCCNWVCIGFRLSISTPLPVVTIRVSWVVVWRNIVRSGEMRISLRAGFRLWCSWHKDSKSCNDEPTDLHDDAQVSTGLWNSVNWCRLAILIFFLYHYFIGEGSFSQRRHLILRMFGLTVWPCATQNTEDWELFRLIFVWI